MNKALLYLALAAFVLLVLLWYAQPRETVDRPGTCAEVSGVCVANDSCAQPYSQRPNKCSDPSTICCIPDEDLPEFLQN